MPVTIAPSPDRWGEWCVSLNNINIVCFSGPSAREQALRRSQELAALLNETAVASDGEAEGGGRGNRTRE